MKVLEFNEDRNTLLDKYLPEKTASYTPISNLEILETIDTELAKHYLSIEKEQYKGNLTQFLGIIDLKSDNTEFGIRIAFGNSYDKSMQFGLAIGANVLVCSNGVVAGEISLKRKHTGDARNEAISKIREGIAQVGEVFNETIKIKDILNNVYIDRNITAEIAGRMVLNEKILNTMQLNILINELKHSNLFNTIDAENYTLWDLYNHTTHSLKKSNPRNYIDKHIKLHKMIKEYV